MPYVCQFIKGWILQTNPTRLDLTLYLTEEHQNNKSYGGGGAKTTSPPPKGP